MASNGFERPLRVALVHDFLVDFRGAERVFAVLCEMWPDADVFTTLYHEAGTDGRFAHRTIHTSFLQRLRPHAGNFRALLPLFRHAIESFDFSGYDLVVSSSSAWAHGVIVDPRTVHVCYCHNPFRYAWNARTETLAQYRQPLRAGLALTFSSWRQWDWVAAQRVDAYVANSTLTQRRIQRYFGRESVTVHPPVDVTADRFCAGVDPPLGDHFLIVSELLRHKKIDTAIHAFNQLRLPLVIVGDGPDDRRLRRLAGPTIRFAGRLSDGEVGQLLRSCVALIVTAQEELGLAAVEAQASGRPVIGHAAGGAAEVVVDGTGTLYDGSPESLAAAVAGFDARAVDPSACRDNARRFDRERFELGVRSVVEETRRVHAAQRAAVVSDIFSVT